MELLKYFSTWKDGESGSVWNQGETKCCGDKTWNFIFYFLWYHCRQTSFRTIETFSPDKLFVFGKTQGSTDAPAPFRGQWVASEAPALAIEVCYRVLEKVYRAQGRQRAQGCVCPQVTSDPILGFWVLHYPDKLPLTPCPFRRRKSRSRTRASGQGVL